MSIRSFWAAAAVLGMVLVALVIVLDNGNIALPDEGVYAAQAQNLSNGSWWSERTAPTIDIEASTYFDPIGPDTIDGDRALPYAGHPLYPLILTSGFYIGGFGGMMLISAAGAWIASIGAGMIARKLSPPAGIPAMLIVGLGSPLFFSAFVVMGQSIAAAAASILVLSTLAYVEGRHRLAIVAVVLSTVVLVGVRSEGLVFVAAWSLATAMYSLAPVTRRVRPDVRALCLAGLTAGSGAVMRLVEVQWATAIRGSSSSEIVGGVVRPDNNPIRSLWISLLQPWHQGTDAFPAAALVFVSVATGAIALRLLPRRPLLGVGLIAMGACSAVWLVVQPPALIAGLLPAFPILLFGVVFLDRQMLLTRTGTLLVLTTLFATLGLAVTIYGDGGATQWGGRFFHVLIPVMAPLAAVGFVRLWSLVGRRTAAISTTLLTAIALTTSFTASARLSHMRQDSAEIVNATSSAFAQAKNAAESPLAIMSQFSTDGSGRAFWNTRDQVDLLQAPHVSAMFPLMRAAVEAGHDRILVVTTRDSETLRIFEDKPRAESAWEVLTDRPIGDTGYRLIEYVPL